MSTELKRVRFLNGGYCVQNEYLVGTGRLRWRQFQAVFVYFEHPIHGPSLIDSGYGPQVDVALKHLPARAMRWLLPIPRGQVFERDDYLPSIGIEPSEIRR